MNEERKMILEMLNNGDISVDEAEKLLSALSNNKDNEIVPAKKVSSGLGAKRIRITITDNISLKNRADIRVPITLLKAALKIGKASLAMGAKYTTDQDSQMVLDLLKEVDIDEVLSSIDDGEITLPYTMIDMDDMENGKNEHVEIVLE